MPNKDGKILRSEVAEALAKVPKPKKPKSHSEMQQRNLQRREEVEKLFKESKHGDKDKVLSDLESYPEYEREDELEIDED